MPKFKILIWYAQKDSPYATVLEAALEKRRMSARAVSIKESVSFTDERQLVKSSELNIVLVSPAFVEESRRARFVKKLFWEIRERGNFIVVTTGGVPRLEYSPSEIFAKFEMFEVFRPDRDPRELEGVRLEELPFVAESYLQPDKFKDLLKVIEQFVRPEYPGGDAQAAGRSGISVAKAGSIMLALITISLFVYAYLGRNLVRGNVPHISATAISIPPAYFINAGLILCGVGLLLTIIRHVLEFTAARRVWRSLLSIIALRPPDKAR
jgi:hypothetical protein